MGFIVNLQFRYYKAPEHLFGSRIYAPSTDIWSLGSIFCHLLRGSPLFTGESDIEQIGQIVRIIGPPPATVLDEVCILISSLSQEN